MVSATLHVRRNFSPELVSHSLSAIVDSRGGSICVRQQKVGGLLAVLLRRPDIVHLFLLQIQQPDRQKFKLKVLRLFPCWESDK